MHKIVTPEAIIMTVLDEIGASFPDETVRNLGDLVEHNEPGVALDILCSQILEYGLELSGKNRTRLKDTARLMGVPFSQLDGLAD